MQGNRGHVEYSAAKGGVLMLTKALSMELAEFGINVNAVSPGLVERGSRDLGHTNFIGRNCTGEDIASTIAFLASEESSFTIGQNHVVDGGWGIGVQHDVKSCRYDYPIMRNK